MQIPSWLLIVAALVTAVPFGFLLGLIAAYVKAGSNVGMLPFMTIPPAILAGIVFAVVPVLSAGMRLAIMGAATAAMFIAVVIIAMR